jgi:hypothetical protein
MADTIHKKIIDQLKAKIQLIRINNGYATDLGANVYHQSPAPVTDGELPACNIRDENVIFDPGALSGTHQHFCRLETQIDIYASGDNAISTIYAAIGDTIKAIGSDRTLGGNAVNVRLTDYTVATDYTDTAIASSALSFDIEFFINLFDPLNN